MISAHQTRKPFVLGHEDLSELRGIFRRIVAEGSHSGFVRDFAATIARADDHNTTLMCSAAVAIIEKYDLLPTSSPSGEGGGR